MSSADLLEDSFPHGSVDGYRDGCRGALCPAVISCRDVHRRYCGDFSFKKAIDAGATLEEILQRDREARSQARSRSLAPSGAPQEKPAPAPRTASPTRQRTPGTQPSSGPARTSQKRVARPTPTPPRKRLTPPTRRAVRTPSAPVVRTEPAWVAQLKELHAASRTDREIAEAMGIDRPAAARRRRSLGLPLNPAPRKTSAMKSNRPKRSKWDGVELQPCGTYASYVRGCRCELCGEARRTYHQEYVARRRAEGIPAEHHGTAYGYQLGCHDRDSCPSTPACSDASIAEERRRRREAGIPAQPPRVDAAPVREHVRNLMNNGRSVKAIAADADVSLSGLKMLLYGRSGARKGEMPTKIDVTKATKLLALT